MRDLRKIYRAQYLQRLAEVTEEEREKQLQLYLQEQRERRQRREELLERLYEDRKRRAVLKDRLHIEKKVTQALQTARVSRRKVGRLRWLQKLQHAADFMQQQEEAAAIATAAAAAARRRREREGDSAATFADEELNVAEALLKAKDEAFRQIRSRNISVPDLLKELDEYFRVPAVVQRMQKQTDTLVTQNDEQVKSVKKKITAADNVFREIMEESFALLPEDAPEYDEEGGIDSQRERASVLSDRERAAITYAGFSEGEKLHLLDEKIAMLNRKLDEDYALRGGPQSLMYVQLRDHLQAAKVAFHERRYVEETERRLRQAREDKEAPVPPDSTSLRVQKCGEL